MAPHLPSSTLFPYTTLFRSLRQTLTIDDTRRRPLVVHQRNNNDFFVQIFGVAHENAQAQRAYVFGNGDRKSTRLNSSHVEISYAVFCLKKKMMTVLNTLKRR